MSNGYETWFRGEGVGVKPGKPGGSIMDFGDGMYLSDRADVADVYAARRATSPDGKRVYTVPLARNSLGRVLDLSADSRWATFMNDPPHPGLKGPSRRQFATQQQESYYGFFQEFLKQFKIDIKGYDAVIGPEYTTGGRQLCILHQNGQASQLQDRVRLLMRPLDATGQVPQTTRGTTPATTPEGTAPPVVDITKLGRLRLTLRAIAGYAAGAAFTILLGWVLAKIREKTDAKIIDQKLKKLEPAIDERLNQFTMKALALLSVGRPAYANITVKIWTMDITEAVDGHAMVVTTIPAVDLVDVGVSHIKFEGAGEPKTSSSPPYNTSQTFYPVFISPPLTFPGDQVDRFRTAINELFWYEETLDNGILDKTDVARLSGEKQEREKAMEQAYGPFPMPPVGPRQRRYFVWNWFDDD